LEIDAEFVVAASGLWTVANMLVSTHGDGAETHAQSRLAEAQTGRNKAGEIVWA
jgi:hypothetical protein